MDIFIIRKGVRADVPHLFGFVKELAEFERAPEQVVNTIEQLEQDGFGENPIYEVLVAEHKDSGVLMGMALFYTAFSTWKGRLLFLDDLYVKPEYRAFGVGKSLMDGFLKRAQELKVKQVRWQVLDWNENALRFYEKLGAFVDKEWYTCKMTDLEIKNYLNRK